MWDRLRFYNLYSPYNRINFGRDRYGDANQLTVNPSTNGTSWAQDFTNTYQHNKRDMLKLTTFSPTQNLLFDCYPTDEIKQISFTNGTTTKYAYSSPKWRAQSIWLRHTLARKKRDDVACGETETAHPGYQGYKTPSK
ncbi:MAG: hypothetical protein GXP23_09770 [Gammaproteobacteria bacterium]|nr:hypothetical protein [Gammaproteobacteria bacterium]